MPWNLEITLDQGQNDGSTGASPATRPRRRAVLSLREAGGSTDIAVVNVQLRGRVVELMTQNGTIKVSSIEFLDQTLGKLGIEPVGEVVIKQVREALSA